MLICELINSLLMSPVVAYFGSKFCVSEKRDQKWIERFEIEVFRFCYVFAPAERLKSLGTFLHLIWVIYSVCTLALTVAKTSSHYDRVAIYVPAMSLLLFDLARQNGNISGPEGLRGTRGAGTISDGQTLNKSAWYLKILIRSRFR